MQNYFGYRTQRQEAASVVMETAKKVGWTRRGQVRGLKRLNVSLESDDPVNGKNGPTTGSMSGAAKPKQQGTTNKTEQDEERRTKRRLKGLKRRLGTKVNWNKYYKNVAGKKPRKPVGSTSGFMSTDGRAPSNKLATKARRRRGPSPDTEDTTDEDLESGEVLDLTFPCDTSSDEDSNREQLKQVIYEETGTSIEF